MRGLGFPGDFSGVLQRLGEGLGPGYVLDSPGFETETLTPSLRCASQMGWVGRFENVKHPLNLKLVVLTTAHGEGWFTGAGYC